MSANILPVHRQLVLALATGFVCFASWAAFAKLDVVVSARGKLVPSSFVRVAQPAEGGVVRAVLVHDGQRVSAGQELVELDPVTAGEDARGSNVLLKRLRLQLARIDAELAGQPFVPDSDDRVLAESARQEYQLRQQALSVSLREAAAARTKAESDLATSQGHLVRAQQLLPLVDSQAQMQRKLAAEGFVSQSAATDKERELVDARQDLAAQETSVASAKAALTQADSTLERVRSDYRRQLATERAQAIADLTGAETDAAKKAHRLQLTTLRAPAAGVVNGLSSLSVGQVVSTGSTLLSVVPDSEVLRFEGWIRNEDAADVVPGMAAKVKLNAFPFQKYGWVEAEVAWMGADAELPDTMRNAQGEPLYYRVRLDLRDQRLHRGGKSFDLKSGMQAVGDVQVEKRTLFEYLTSPARRVLAEAAREK